MQYHISLLYGIDCCITVAENHQTERQYKMSWSFSLEVHCLSAELLSQLSQLAINLILSYLQYIVASA